MLIAKEKRRNNIAEYILYMWQLEDILRALNFDSEGIRKTLTEKYHEETEMLEEIHNWYMNLVFLMKNEGVTEKGHIQILINIVNDLNQFHLKLLSRPEQADYIQSFQNAFPIIGELKLKQPGSKGNIPEICLNALYGLLLLRLKKREISESTEKSLQVIASFMAKLSAKYLQYESGDLELD